MRVPRFYTRQPLHEGAEVNLEDEPSHHLRQVLRLRAGAEINLFNDNGNEYTATLTLVSKQHVSATVGTQLRREHESKLTVHLLIGISRGERMDFALQKATELGICRITPVLTKRCVVKLNEKKSASRVAHWSRLVINACEQSGRCRIPTIDHPLELKEAPLPGRIQIWLCYLITAVMCALIKSTTRIHRSLSLSALKVD